MTSMGPEAVVVRGGGESDPKAAQGSRARLEELLRETAAYRGYFRGADAQSLVAVGEQ
jgi:hypothetical protein